ncbi:hypothetical protein [Rhodoglobus sp.]
MSTIPTMLKGAIATTAVTIATRRIRVMLGASSLAWSLMVSSDSQLPAA